MSDTSDEENKLLSFSNPNYQLEQSNINSNLEPNDDLNYLYEELDAVCRFSHKPAIKSRHNYAHLDSLSMGVELAAETTPMLSDVSDYNQNEDNLRSSSDGSKAFVVDNAAEFDTNENKDMGKRSGFLEYYISLEEAARSKKETTDLVQNIQRSEKISVDKSLNSSLINKDFINSSKKLGSFESTVSCINNIAEDQFIRSDNRNSYCEDLQQSTVCNFPSTYSGCHISTVMPGKESDDSYNLPAGWEKHEDDSGPYYWHISSGTIQREPPSSYENICKIQTKTLKDVDMVSSSSDFSLNSGKTSSVSFATEPVYSNSFSPHMDIKLKRRSYPAGSCSLTPDKKPIRFAVRSLGWVEIAEDDLTPEKSSKAVNKCIVDLSLGRNDILDVVGRWGDGKDLFMDLDDYSLRLMDTQDLTILNTQPIHTIRVWGVGRDNGRDFAYVARDRITRKHMCHVFRCDIPARIIANTLRDICKKIMIEKSLQHSLAKPVGPDQERSIKTSILNHVGPIRPNNLPTEQRRLHNKSSQSSYTAQSFPTPMEEPKKVLKVHYLGTINVLKATGVEILNDAIEQLAARVKPPNYKFVNIAVAPSTITIFEPEDESKLLAECRVRFLSFLGIGKNVKFCGFIVHTAQDQFIAHVFYCEPSSGALCKTIEAACKLRYQKCLDAHRKVLEKKRIEEHSNKGIATTIRSVLGSLTRLTRSVET